MATLYVVSTPIGNLADLSPRAADTLRSVRRILAEDTRRTRVLAAHAGAQASLVSLHEHNEAERTGKILEWLAAGEDLALVTDAGTPLVSDPGGRVVRAVAEAGFEVVPIPGPSAVLAALVGSGLPSGRFAFLGFAERKGGARRELLERVAGSRETVVLFESPNRLAPLLEDLAQACGRGRAVAVARELTKVHEEFFRGTLEEAIAYYRDRPARGEVTVVVAPAEDAAVRGDRTEAVRLLAEELLALGGKPSEVARKVAERLDVARNEAYRIVHDLGGDATDE